MKRLREVAELEPLVIDKLVRLDPPAKLKLLAQQVSTGDAGRVDLLAVDKDGSLCVVELKAEEAGVRAIAQLLRYYDFYSRKRGELSRASPIKVNPKADVRLYLVAPNFDSDARRLSYYITPPLKLIKFGVSGNRSHRDVSFRREQLRKADRKESLRFRGPQEIISLITEPAVRREFLRAKKDLESLGLKMLPYLHQGRNALEFRTSPFGTLDAVAYLTAWPKHFVGWWWDWVRGDSFRSRKIKTYKEWNTKVRPNVLRAIENWK